MRRPSALVFILLGLLLAGFAGSLFDAALLCQERGPAAAATGALAARLGLADLALFTEARYTRHPAQADLHSAFQDHPVALEHFPSGSFILPRHENLVRAATASD